jgi:hypothetical protein
VAVALTLRWNEISVERQAQRLAQISVQGIDVPKVLGDFQELGQVEIGVLVQPHDG